MVAFIVKEAACDIPTSWTVLKPQLPSLTVKKKKNKGNSKTLLQVGHYRTLQRNTGTAEVKQATNLRTSALSGSDLQTHHLLQKRPKTFQDSECLLLKLQRGS